MEQNVPIIVVKTKQELEEIFKKHYNVTVYGRQIKSPEKLIKHVLEGFYDLGSHYSVVLNAYEYTGEPATYTLPRYVVEQIKAYITENIEQYSRYTITKDELRKIENQIEQITEDIPVIKDSYKLVAVYDCNEFINNLFKSYLNS